MQPKNSIIPCKTFCNQLKGVALALILLTPLLAACSAPVAQPEELVRVLKNPEILVGLSLPNDSEAFYQAIKKGAERVAGRRGIQLQVRSARDDADLQENNIQSFIEQRAAVIVILPIDSQLVSEAILSANQAGIPVFTLERRAASGTVVTHLAVDNESGGKMAARYVGTELEGRGLVVELQGSASISTSAERSRGFVQGLRAYTGIRIVASEPANGNEEQAREVFARILTQQAQIDAVFAHNDEMLVGARQAAEEAGRAADILFLGFDAIPEVVNGIERGTFSATIAQQPEELGQLGIELALRYLAGETIPDLITLDLALLSR